MGSLGGPLIFRGPDISTQKSTARQPFAEDRVVLKAAAVFRGKLRGRAAKAGTFRKSNDFGFRVWGA